MHRVVKTILGDKYHSKARFFHKSIYGYFFSDLGLGGGGEKKRKKALKMIFKAFCSFSELFSFFFFS